MQITEKELRQLAEYIADYVTDELIRLGEQTRSGYMVDSFLIQDALSAYVGGASDTN